MRTLAAALVVLLAAVIPQVSSALILSFENISANNVNDAAIGESQLTVEVTGKDNQAFFKFMNAGPLASSITDVYFDDGTLLGIAALEDSGGGVAFSKLASPGELPSANYATPPFVTTAGFSADSDPPAQPNGVNPGEWLQVTFNLLSGQDFDDVLSALALGGADGGLRIGIHVQGFASGGSEAFVNDGGTPLPEPNMLLVMGSGLAMLGGVAWRHWKH